MASSDARGRRISPVALACVLLLAGCASGPSPPPPGSFIPSPAEGSPTATPTGVSTTSTATAGADATTTQPTPTDGLPSPDPTSALPGDAWRTTPLRDVRSGETLVVNELIGRLVVIEPMAIWCTNCRAQQNEARTALASLGRPDIVYISLDVDPNETEPDLAVYADTREYPWHFVVAPREVSRSLAEVFGDQVLSPPSTPKIVIAPDGSTKVSFGLKRADDLAAEFSALLP